MFCAKPRVTLGSVCISHLEFMRSFLSWDLSITHLDDGSYKLLCLASVEGIAVPRYSQSVS